MATRCTKCGTFLTDGERFCPNCGENAPQPAPQLPQPQPYNQYGQNAAAGQNGYAAPGYNAGYQSPSSEEMSLGKWLGTILLTNFLGLISLVLLFVWAFGSGPKSRQNYCKAMLIVRAIGIVLIFVLFPLLMAMIIPALESIADSVSPGYFFDEYAAVIGSFIH